MKFSIFTAIAVTFFSVSALAQHEAGGIPSRPVDTRDLITHARHNGFMMPHVVEKIVISTNGSVTLYNHTTYSDRSISSQQVLGTIDHMQILGLIGRIDAVNDNLVDLNEGEPYCTDAPAWSNRINYSNSDTVMVGQWASCHDYRNEDAAFIGRIMDGWLAVAGRR